jgi:hypothetical protein
MIKARSYQRQGLIAAFCRDTGLSFAEAELLPWSSLEQWAADRGKEVDLETEEKCTRGLYDGAAESAADFYEQPAVFPGRREPSTESLN